MHNLFFIAVFSAGRSRNLRAERSQRAAEGSRKDMKKRGIALLMVAAMMAGTLSGCSGPVEYRDVSALLGSSYEYYITKIHPNMAENGRNIESEPSRCMYVIMGGQ